MEGHCSTGQSPKWAIVPMEEEEEEYDIVTYAIYDNVINNRVGIFVYFFNHIRFHKTVTIKFIYALKLSPCSECCTFSSG